MSDSLDRARRDFEEWAEASDQYEPPHLCERGEENPQPESCIPCNLVAAARRLEAAARQEGYREGQNRGREEDREALRKIMAAARLAGRVEQAELSVAAYIKNSKMEGHMSPGMLLDRLLNDVRAELAAAGKEKK